MPSQRHVLSRPPRTRRMHVRRLLLRRLDRLPELRLRARRSLARNNQRLPHNSLLCEQRTLHRYPDGQFPGHLLVLAVFSRGERDGDGRDGSVSESNGRELVLTPTGVQGPGAITGSATAATKTGSAGSESTSTGSGGSGSKTSGGSAGSQSTSSSKAGAAPTGVWMGGLGLAAGVVGMVIL
jgi:hypothetical protein